MFSFCLLAIALFQGEELPVFPFQSYRAVGGGLIKDGPLKEGKFDFGVRLGDLPPSNLIKKRIRLIGRQGSNRDHGLKIVTLKRQSGLHPWMSTFNRLEAGLDDSGRIRLLRGKVFLVTSSDKFNKQRVFAHAFDKAGYQKVTRLDSEYLRAYFPTVGDCFIDPANRAIHIRSFEGTKWKSGGVYIEIFDAGTALEDAKARKASMERERVAAAEARQRENEEFANAMGSFESLLVDQIQGTFGNKNVNMETYGRIKNGDKLGDWVQELGQPNDTLAKNDVVLYMWQAVIGIENRVDHRGNVIPKYGYLWVKARNQVVIGKGFDGLKPSI